MRRSAQQSSPCFRADVKTPDWYRSPEWDEAVERDFRQRLARASHHNQIQYRRIKGITLLNTGDPAKSAAGRRLLIEVVESSEGADFEKVIALSTLGERALRDGQLDEAEANLREALRIAGDNGSGTTGLEEAWLAQVALARGDRGGFREALDLVARRAHDPPQILSARFEICLTAAKLAVALGDPVAAASWARSALTLADAEHSGLANHPTLGLVEVTAQTRAWLNEVAESA